MPLYFVANPASAAARAHMRRWLRLTRSAAVQWAIQTALIFALILAGMGLEAWSGRLIVGWPLNAVALAFLLRTRTKRWPSFVASFVIACLLPPMAHGKPPLVSAGMSLANGAEIVGWAALLRRLLGEQIDLARTRDLWVFSLVAVVCAPLLSITINNFAGVDHRMLIEGSPRLIHWAVGNALGYLLVTPTILAWTRGRTGDLARRVQTTYGHGLRGLHRHRCRDLHAEQRRSQSPPGATRQPNQVRQRQDVAW